MKTHTHLSYAALGARENESTDPLSCEMISSIVVVGSAHPNPESSFMASNIAVAAAPHWSGNFVAVLEITKWFTAIFSSIMSTDDSFPPPFTVSRTITTKTTKIKRPPATKARAENAGVAQAAQLLVGVRQVRLVQAPQRIP